MSQSGKMVVDITIDTLVIKFGLGKYEEFLHATSLSNKQKNNTFSKARGIISSSFKKPHISAPANANIGGKILTTAN